MVHHFLRIRLASDGTGVMLWINARLNAVSRTNESG